MKTLSSVLIGLAIFGGSATATAQLAPQDLQPQRASFAERMPASTILYVEIPDIVGLRAGIEKSSLGKIYNDDELQTFLGESISLLDQSWAEIRGMAVGFGVPEELTYWEALRSLEVGLALEAQAGLENPFDDMPNVFFAARIGLSEGLSEPVFALLTNFLEPEGFEVIGTDSGQALTMTQGEIFNPEAEWFTVEILQEGDDIVLEVTMGTKPGGSLAATAGYSSAHNSLYTDGAVVFGYFQIKDIMKTIVAGLKAEAPAEVHEMISMIYDRAVRPLDNIAFSSGWTDEGTFTKSRVQLTENPGDLYTYGQADLALLDYVPSEATGFYVTSAPSKAWGSFLLDCLDMGGAMDVGDGHAAHEMLQSQSAELHTWLFGDKRPELEAALAAFGDQTMGYSISQGMASETVTLMELNDGPALSAVFEQLMPRLREMLEQTGAPVGLDMKYVRRRVKQDDGSVTNVPGPAYYMVNLDGLADIPPQAAVILGSLQPTMGVTEDGWLVFSMSKQRVRQMLLKGLEKPETNIKSNVEAAAFVNSLSDSVGSIAWSDPRQTVGALAGMAVGFAPMAFNMVPPDMDLPVDKDNTPSAELFVRHLRTSEAVSWSEGDTHYSSHVGSIGLADVFTVLGSSTALAPPIFQLFMMQSMEGPYQEEAMAEPEEVEYDEEF